MALGDFVDRRLQTHRIQRAGHHQVPLVLEERQLLAVEAPCPIPARQCPRALILARSHSPVTHQRRYSGPLTGLRNIAAAIRGGHHDTSISQRTSVGVAGCPC